MTEACAWVAGGAVLGVVVLVVVARLAVQFADTNLFQEHPPR